MQCCSLPYYDASDIHTNAFFPLLYRPMNIVQNAAVSWSAPYLSSTYYAPIHLLLATYTNTHTRTNNNIADAAARWFECVCVYCSNSRKKCFVVLLNVTPWYIRRNIYLCSLQKIKIYNGKPSGITNEAYVSTTRNWAILKTGMWSFG